MTKKNDSLCFRAPAEGCVEDLDVGLSQITASSLRSISVGKRYAGTTSNEGGYDCQSNGDRQRVASWDLCWINGIFK